MAVTVIKRPQGHVLSTTLEDALVTDDYGNQGALFENSDHGLVDGDYVYVTSDVDNYNGFWYVEQINSGFFWLREYATGSLLQWVVDTTVSYRKSILTHGWSCVHLPIVYKLSNNRWPINSIDTARTISSVTDDNGLCALSLSGDIKASGNANALDFVKVSTGDLAGIYQINSWSSDTSFTINVAYSAANDTALTSATIQYYYNNYNIRVRVFAGLTGTHTWASLKPYEELLTDKIVPDSSGLVEVNINEYLKKQIKILSNNLQLASLPNDIDSICQFYISTAETYDTTDGSSITTSTASFTSDATAITELLLSFGVNQTSPSGSSNWNLGLKPTISLSGANESHYLAIPFTAMDGGSYDIIYDIDFGANGCNISFFFLDESLNQLNSFGVPIFDTGQSTGTSVSISVSGGADSVYFAIIDGNGGLANTCVINSISIKDNNTDVFEGIAVNSMLQFKNIHSGYLSDYIPNNSAGKFLTLFDEPVIFAGCYFDISFLVASNLLNLKKEFYKNGSIVSTQNESIPSYGIGLYRKEIGIPSAPTEDRIDITLIGYFQSLIGFTNVGSGAIDWALGTNPSAVLPNFNDFTNLLYSYTPFPFIKGETYSIAINADFGANDTTEISISTLQDAVTIDNGTFSASNTGTTTVTINVTPTSTINAIGIRARNNSVSSNTVIINSLEFLNGAEISETKTIHINTDCSTWDIYLTWKNYLGGMEYWKFTAGKDYGVDIESKTETTKNIYPTWPKSYGAFADTIYSYSSKMSRDRLTVRSQNLTEDQMNGIRYIVSSPLVQVMVSKSDRRTIKVDGNSFTWKTDEDKLYSIEFDIIYTNKIPSQSL